MRITLDADEEDVDARIRTIKNVLFTAGLFATLCWPIQAVQAFRLSNPSGDIMLGINAMMNLNQNKTNCSNQNDLPLKRSGGVLATSKAEYPGDFCLQVGDACIKHTGNHFCASNPTQFNERLNNWDRLAKQVNEIHLKYTSLESAQIMCCKDNQECKRLFRTTKLLVELQSTSNDNLTDEFDNDARMIRLNAKTLSNCSDVECIEEIYLHELGHACQRALVLGSKAEEVDSLGGCTKRPEPKFSTYIRYYGSSASCVFEKVKSQYVKSRLNGVCPDSWYQEAMASVIFGEFLRSPMHFQRVCNSPADVSHPEIDFMIACMKLH